MGQINKLLQASLTTHPKQSKPPNKARTESLPAVQRIISSSINESVQAQPASSADVTSSTTPTSSSESVTGPAIVDGTFEEFERFLALNHEDGKVHSSEPRVTFAGSHDDAAAVKSHPTSATGLCPFRHGTVYGKS